MADGREMRFKEEWQAIEDGVDTISELTTLIATVLKYRNEKHDVAKAVSLTDPDIATIFDVVKKFENFTAILREDGHCDSIQQNVLDVMLIRLNILKDLVEAMNRLDQEAVNEKVQELEWI